MIPDAHLLDKASNEVAYELNYRPDRVILPAHGIRSILRETLSVVA